MTCAALLFECPAGMALRLACSYSKLRFDGAAPSSAPPRRPLHHLLFELR